MNTGNCVGSFFGENPGSGLAASRLLHVNDPIVDTKKGQGDPTLRLILEIWQLSVRSHGKPTPKDDDFIEVLNTYYFRNGKSEKSLAAWRLSGGSAIFFPAPRPSSNFVLLGWGVGHNSTSEACAAARLLGNYSHIIIPDSTGAVTVTTGTTVIASWPVAPAPVAPSYMLRKSKTLLPTYKRNVARAL